GGAGRGRRVVGRSAGLRLLARLATVAGADERPGILLGWGPVHADLVRGIAADTDARWWYVLVNGDGSPAAIGPIHTRPHTGTASDPEPAPRSRQRAASCRLGAGLRWQDVTTCRDLGANDSNGRRLPRGSHRLHVWLQVTQQ